MQHHLLLLLLLLFIQAATASSVPGCRSDRDKDHRSRENCTAAGFSDIPAGLDHKTQVLLFPYNLFSTLSWTSFQIFTGLHELDLTTNKVPEVTPGSAPVLPSLSVLRLGSNLLTSLSDNSFAACPGLTELYLENNSITSLSDHAFSGLSKLEILDMTSNRISTLPDLMLHPLPAIETLYLEKNKIKLMPDDWFSQKEEVPYLYLSDNPWVCSCSLDYLRRYLEDYELNVYVRDGPEITIDGLSVICDAPQRLQGKPLLTLEESDLCPRSAENSRGDSNSLSSFLVTSVASDAPSTPEPTLALHTSSVPSTPEPTLALHTSSVPSTPEPTLTLHTSSVPSTPEPTLALHTSSVPSTPEPTLALHTSLFTSSVPSTPDPTTTQYMTSVFPEKPPTIYDRMVTWSWYQTFTSLSKTSHYSRSEIKTESSSVVLFAQTTHQIPVTGRPSQTTFRTTTSSPLTRKSTTVQTIPAATKTTSTTVTSLVSNQSAVIRQHFKVSSAGVGAAFCVWLFAGFLVLCVASGASVLVTAVKLIMWYKKVYRPLSLTLARRLKDREAVALLMRSKMEENAVVGDGGVVALYRSLLFVHREGGDINEGNKEQIITLKLAGEETGTEDRVYRKTMYRLLSREEEIQGWRDVVEECRVSADDRGGKKEPRMDKEPAGGAGGVSKKRYSVILREEREEKEGEREELNWVVGGWEVKRGAEGGPRSSWGEWLSYYLPSMPWGLAVPSEEEAATQ